MTQAEKDQENGKEKEKERDKEKEQQRGVKRPIAPAAVPESLQEVRATGMFPIIPCWVNLCLCVCMFISTISFIWTHFVPYSVIKI